MKSLRFILSATFVLASVMKAVNIHSFASEIRMYIDAYMSEWLEALVMPLAIVVCSLELWVGLLAWRQRYVMVTSVMFAVMMSFFVYLTGLNLFFPTIMGSIESCGCFGELVHFSPFASFVKSAVLWVLAIILLGYCVRLDIWHDAVAMIKDWRVYFVGITSVVLPVFSLLFFERLDHTMFVISYIGVLSVVLLSYIYFCVKHEG